MKISSETINILKNFSGINANLVFKPGKELKTISEAKTIMANASIPRLKFSHNLVKISTCRNAKLF